MLHFDKGASKEKSCGKSPSDLVIFTPLFPTLELIFLCRYPPWHIFLAHQGS